ncbi:MAG: 2-amino-4-hydroxy-6-hydroxymethyldihydropteridine diphosphokinase [Bacteroidetes bacterium]|nr:2-amino-4-hydroxy-6-hydroxymethyldihydropteridine diphosphokinase [Bacteroidota bacterium]
MPGKHHIFLSLGSNLGDRESNLREGLRFVEHEIGVILRRSSIYESEPWMMDNTGWFLNQVVEVISTLQPEETLSRIHRYEATQGRKRTPGKYIPRNIDIDILFFDHLVNSLNDLMIPHPRIPERNFILYPMEEIACEYVHPLLHINITDLKQKCVDKSRIHIYSPKENP